MSIFVVATISYGDLQEHDRYMIEPENEIRAGSGDHKLSEPTSVVFDYRKNCVYCVNDRCIDMLNRNYNKKCDGRKNCSLPWRDDGWVSHSIRSDEE